MTSVVVSLFAVTIAVSATQLRAATDSAAAQCTPPCRSGFSCVNGECMSQCNPPCPAGEKCDPTKADCVPADAVQQNVNACTDNGGCPDGRFCLRGTCESKEWVSSAGNLSFWPWIVLETAGVIAYVGWTASSFADQAYYEKTASGTSYSYSGGGFAGLDMGSGIAGVTTIVFASLEKIATVRQTRSFGELRLDTHKREVRRQVVIWLSASAVTAAAMPIAMAWGRSLYEGSHDKYSRTLSSDEAEVKAENESRTSFRILLPIASAALVTMAINDIVTYARLRGMLRSAVDSPRAADPGAPSVAPYCGLDRNGGMRAGLFVSF